MIEPGEFTEYEKLQVEKIANAVVLEIKKERKIVWASIIVVGLIACYGAGIRTIMIIEKVITKFLG